MNRFDDSPGSDRPFGTQGSSADLSGFGFDLPDEEWMRVVRSAEKRAELGSIGSYELIEEISRGAQGIVYRARQPNTRREIALKRLVAGSFAAPMVRARFEREVRIASNLNHPNIVTVYGSEVHEGQPNLAMEWIDGVRVDRWAHRNPAGRRSVEEVLRVFAVICDAVHHAHQRGVIHRDLKPSNILVDAEDRPHILDFGLAKILEADDVEAAHLTQTRDFVGTPAYASPEQVRGRQTEVDVRSDVYALGVILFQMLTGRLPYPDDRNLAELLQAIKDREPPSPSSLDARLDREIDAIVLKALSKEPARRYASVDGLAADVRRYLAGEPVSAHPPTTTYYLRKMIARHRLPFALASAAAILVIGFSIATTMLSYRLNEQRNAAVLAESDEAKARQVAEQVNAFLRNLLEAAEPDRAGGEEVTVREVLDKAASRVEERDDLAPEVEAAIRGTIGATYNGLGLLEPAERHLQIALKLAREAHGDTHVEVARHLRSLGNVYRVKGQHGEAGQVYEEAYSIFETVLEPGHEDIAVALANLAVLAMEHHDLDTGERQLRSAIDMLTRRLGDDHRQTLAAKLDLALVYRERGQLDEAAARLRSLLPAVHEAFGPDHTRSFQAMNNLAVILKNMKEYDEAQGYYEALIENARRIYGDDHPHTIQFEANLASLLQARGDLDEAEAALRAVFARATEVLGDASPTTLSIMNNLAGTLASSDRSAEAIELFRRSVEGSKALYGDRHPVTAIAMGGLGHALIESGAEASQYREAESLLKQALAIFETALPADHPFRRKTREGLRTLYGPDHLNDVEALTALDSPLDDRAALGGEQEEGSPDR